MKSSHLLTYYTNKMHKTWFFFKDIVQQHDFEFLFPEIKAYKKQQNKNSNKQHNYDVFNEIHSLTMLASISSDTHLISMLSTFDSEEPAHKKAK